MLVSGNLFSGVVSFFSEKNSAIFMCNVCSLLGPQEQEVKDAEGSIVQYFRLCLTFLAFVVSLCLVY